MSYEYTVRDFDSPELTIGQLAQPVSALEVSPRCEAEFYQHRMFGGQGCGPVHMRTRDANKIMKDVRDRLNAEKRWKKREALLRAAEVVSC